MDKPLIGKKALVTGGAQRVGRVLVRALQDAGAEVIVHYRRSQEEAEALSPKTLHADLRAPKAGEELIRRAAPVDILINNASVFTRDSLPHSTPPRIQQEFAVNLFAPMELIRQFALQGRPGTIINLLDRRITTHDTSCAPYLLTKKGLAELTRLAALQYAPSIRVNAIAPGPVLPPSSGSTEPAGTLPLQKNPTPEELAQAMLFLLQAPSITGQIIYVDSGQHLL